MIKRIFIAWDPEFTKVTEEERKRIFYSEQELESGEYVSHEDVWSFLEDTKD